MTRPAEPERPGRKPIASGWPLDVRALPVFFALLAMTFAFSLGYVWTGDLWWYLASGGEILRLGSIPSFDPFVYSLPEPAKWLTHSWLWTVILSWLEDTFGLWALPFTGTLLTGAIVTLIFTRARLDRFGLVNGLLTALVVLVASHRFALRAELPGWLLLVVFIRTFDRVGPFSLRGAILLASAQWLWSNLHGGFTLGILTALAYGVGGFIQNRWSKSLPPTASSDWRASDPHTLQLGYPPPGRGIPGHARSRRPAPRGRDPGDEPVLRGSRQRRIASHRRVAKHLLTSVHLPPMGLRRLLVRGRG